MKKLYSILTLVFVAAIGNAQIVTIPDAGFKAKLLASTATNTTAVDLSGNYFKIDADSDGQIQVSEALQVKELNLLLAGNIASLDGINSFSNLTKLQHSYSWGSALTIVDLTGLTQLNYLEIRCTNLNLGQKDTLETLLLGPYGIPLTYNSSTSTLKKFRGHINTFLTINYTKRVSLQDLKLYGFNSGQSTLQYTELKYVTGLISLDLGYTSDANGDGIQLGFQNYNTLDNPLYPQNIKNLVVPSLHPNLPLQNFQNLESLTFKSIGAGADGVQCSCPAQPFNPSNFPLLKKLVFYRFYNSIQNLDLSVLTHLESFETKEIFVSTGYSGSVFPINFGNNLNLTEVILTDLPTANLDFTGNPNLKTLKILPRDLDFTPMPNVTISLAPNNLLETLRFEGNTFYNGSQTLNPSINITNLETSNTLKSIYFGNCNLVNPFEINSLLLTSFYAFNTYFTTLSLGNVPSLTSFELQIGDPYLGNPFTTDLSVDLSGASSIGNIDIIYPQLRFLSVKNGKQDTNIDVYNDDLGLTVCVDNVDCFNPLCFSDMPENTTFTNYCTLTPNGTFNTISGNVRFDSDLNGCSATDIPFPFLKLKSTVGSNNTITFSNTAGDYFQYLGLGNYTTIPVFENPTYFTANPVSFTSNFTTFDTVQNQDICVTANGVFNDLDVTVLPMTAATPGFTAKYKILLRNKGTAALSGNLSFSFDAAKINFVSASLTPNSVNLSTINWNYTNLLPLNQTEIVLNFIVNSPTDSNPVNSGALLVFNAVITNTFTDQTPNDNAFTLNQIVVNAFDPNDKTCLEGLTISPDKIGDFVNYIIRFENLGTANATNVVVKDIINTNRFDINSIIPLDSSHPFRMTVSNSNQVEFFFENINLPFDDANNNGYVAFKIKTKSNLVVGNTFANTASIYFDYNAAIVTNTATTIVQLLGTSDFDFGSMFTLSPVPAKNALTITTKQDVVISSISIYNVLGQLVQVNTNPNETIDVSGLKTGNYFIKILSDKGTASSQFIKQ